ncbi:glycerophosphodiester phosphodiesterase 1 [Drosophila guanche]|uniref:Blast:Glycerophosphodiester phosphodiesterase 1 n=1 Tax=Drosophila guanche TaxID=7266 RepID=A0A3B0JN01_DROGU|nr:glycerophosphodiester phosphodiesterase 1 [Drosophila guanche]XP_034130943.1 glycerophosphodiester phosphodiesterase 1 [Drosophila guanche]SPP83617.1 blast:Glycerophosphodiester phosphodiesterase 1 [Drosophila guanche]
MYWRWLWLCLKMIYQVLCCSVSLIFFCFNVFWLFCNLAIPWCTLTLLVVCVVSKFVKLQRSPNEKRLLSLLSAPDDWPSYWPIANRAAGYDAPENSKAAIKKCLTRGYRNVLLDAGLTSCGEIVIANPSRLPVAQQPLSELQKLNITEQHPMGSHFEAESVATLRQISDYVETEASSATLFLRLHDNSARMLDQLQKFMATNEAFTKRTIVISRSPLAIYQLRKLHPEIICGLWHETYLSLAMLKSSTLITSIYGAIFRNIIAPVIGISVVFLSKEEFNLHIADLWRNVGVRPIVYMVNSPNEKRYFQKTMKIQYLTDSLRSEPHLLMKA